VILVLHASSNPLVGIESIAMFRGAFANGFVPDLPGPPGDRSETHHLELVLAQSEVPLAFNIS